MSIVHETTKRALVVGGTSGIGQGIAMALAKRDYQVIVCGRSAERGNAVVDSLKALGTGPTEGGGTGSRQHSFLPIDAFDLSSVRGVAEKTVAGGNKLDVLVMTQSMASLQGYTPTKDGIDQKLQLHFFSRVYLACLLAPHMRAAADASSPPPKILSVLSAGVHSRYKHADTDFELKNHYSVKNAADAAGFYTDAGLEKVAEEHPSVAVCHAAPGFVNTNWGTEMPWAIRMMLRPMQSVFGKSLEDCGETITSGLMNGIVRPGFYLMGEKGQILEKSAVKHTPQERDMIWEKTLQLLPDLN
jgi:NAD(P)-dependent dehydrogenase (short-subunit alcohol dehydrogenase family)